MLCCADSKVEDRVSPSNETWLKCLEGNTLNFECPCPAEVNECTFKKEPREEHIFKNGKVTLPSIYELDERRTYIKIKNCASNDGGLYVWDCKGCGVMKEFRVRFYRVINESLYCPTGSEVSFKCLCCVSDLETCSFVKNPSEGLHIVTDGKLNDNNPRYQFNMYKTHMVLRDCTEDDKGTYNWNCPGCQIYSQFQLTIDKEGRKIPSDSPKGISIWKTSSAILLILAVILVEN